MEIVAWNTKRSYSLKGQRIAACQYSDQKVYFVDVDRGIEGMYDALTTHDKLTLKDSVMHHYDYNEYRGMWPAPENVAEALRAAALAL